MDLARRIRMELGDGKSPDQIVVELTNAGMTEAAARRHVRRALGERVPISTPQDTSKDPTGRDALVRGALLFSGLVSMMALSAVLAGSGALVSRRSYLVGILGVMLFARGLYKWLRSDSTDFPGTAIVYALLAPPLLAVAISGGVYGWRRWNPPARETRVTEEAKPPEKPGPPKHDELVDGRSIMDAHNAAISTEPARRCLAAHDYGVREMIEASSTLKRLAQESDPLVQKCALDAYAVWLRSDVYERRRAAVSDLGGVGSDADPLLRQVAANGNEPEELRKLANDFLERHAAQDAAAQRQSEPAPTARQLHFGTAEERCKAATAIGERELFYLGTTLATVMAMDADPTVKKCARDAFARMLQSKDPAKRRVAIYSLNTAGRDAWDLLQQAANTDPDEVNRKMAANALKREAEKAAKTQGTTRNP